MQFPQILRSLLRDRLNTAVIIISLSAGIASINLIFLFLQREMGTDGFHRNADSMYALQCDDPWIPGAKMYYCRFGAIEFMKNNFPQVEDFCRFNNQNATKVEVNHVDYFDHPMIIGASGNFFNFFSYKLLTNNPETALEGSNSIVISSDLAVKYFGTDEPMGKIINLVSRDKTEPMTVSGIFEKPVDNTQINFDMVRRAGDVDGRCYLKLAKGTDPAELEKLFSEKKDVIPVIHTGTPGSYYLKSLKASYYDSSRGWTVELNRDKKDLWIALIIGLMVMGIAIFNYLGVISNKFHRKVKEFYIRRINGSNIRYLILRFTIENSILIIISFAIAILVMMDVLPFFNRVTGSTITTEYIYQPSQIILLAAVLIFIFIMTLLFDFYLISSNLNINLLKTEQGNIVKSIQIPVFNIFQIACSIGLIICSTVIMKQMNFISNKPIGLDKDVIEVKIPPQHSEISAVFRDELLKNKSVRNVSVTNASPLLEHFLVALKYDDNGTEKEYFPAGFSGDANFLDVLGIKLIEGEGFSSTPAANKNKCLVNQSFMKLFSGQNLIGKGMPGMENLIIAGVISDFNFSDLKSKIEPGFISFDDKGGHLLVKAEEKQTKEAISAISDVWKKLVPDFPVNTESVGDRFQWFHRENENFRNLIGACSLLCLFLSMVGLFAVSYQRTTSRTREIGIRKINGASIVGIMAMINTDFVRWTLIAFALSLPVSWVAMSGWLEGYVYRTDITWWIFAGAGISVLLVSLLTVSVQSWKTASKNPVDALRHE